jgi:RimJ/RimL family protein N-acetyltransferase
VSDQEPSGQPVGPPVDAVPAQRPGPVTLVGRHGRLEKLGAGHAADLWSAMTGRDRLWTYMRAGPFANEAAFAAFIEGCAASQDPCFYAVLDTQDRACGMLSLLNIRPEHRVVEVGHIVYAPSLQRTPLGTETQYLLARYAFETLGYRRYEWKCDALNAASRRAALRYGFVFEGVLRQHMMVKGRNRDTAYFSMLDGEWPARKANFERWLRPENFAAGGRQIESLAALNGPTR